MHFLPYSKIVDEISLVVFIFILEQLFALLGGLFLRFGLRLGHILRVWATALNRIYIMNVYNYFSNSRKYTIYILT